MPGGSVMKRLNDESGQALIITALCMTCLLGFVALAADVGIMLREKRMAQTAADGAAVAGASELAYGAATVSSAAKQASALNGFSDGNNGVTVVVNGPPGGPANGPHAGNASYVEVIVSKVQPTWFMSLFGVLNMTPTARAVATYGVTQTCWNTLNTSGPDITIIGKADITATTCGIVDNSSTNDGTSNSALYLQGKATLNAGSIGIVGGVATTGNVSLTPTPITGVIPSSDPLSYLTTGTNGLASYTTQPSSTSCSAQGTATTLPPGCYNGLSVGSNNTLNLSPGGVYVINGDLALQAGATLNGTGVTLVLWGKTTVQGTPTMNLTAPNDITNPLDGLLIYEPASNSNQINLQGNPGSTLTGIVYAPSAPVSLQGNAGATIALDFVVGSVTLQGDPTLTDYAGINPGSVLKTIRLVE
jgi:Flp pilus assembly protein TadG